MPLSGINLIYHNGCVFVPSNSKFCGLNGDLCLFRVDSDTVFKKSSNFEVLDLSKRYRLENLYAYYHLKFVKEDLGIGNYNFDENPNSVYYSKTLVFLFFMKLVPLKKILNSNNVEMIDFDVKNLEDVPEIHYKREALKKLKSFNIPFPYKKILSEVVLHYKIILLKNKFVIKLLKIRRVVINKLVK